jgi:hypothetical protein
MIRKGLRPRFRFGLELPGSRYGLRRVLPFRRSWIAILVLAVFDAVFLFPAVTTFRQAAAEWARFDSLFDLVGALFLSAWLLGWMVGPLLMTTVLLLMLFGREVLKARPGQVEIWLGVPLLGLGAVYDVSRMRNLRLETPPPKSGHSWRGSHAVFDYGANEVRFGSALVAGDVAELERAIETAARSGIRRGDPRPEEVAGAWESPELLAMEAPAAEVQAAPAAPLPPPSLTSASSIALILANLVPVAGAVFFGWALSDVMVLYWAESAIIGFFNLCKIAVIGRWSALLAGPFFLGHFGGFMAVHFLFIYGIFVEGMQNGGSSGDLREVAELFYRLWPALLALFLSHAYSFFVNFIGRQEYRARTVGDQMSEPYGRIVFMHVVLIFGGFLTMLLGGPTVVLIIVIALKIWFDLRAHQKQHFSRVKKTKPARSADRGS